MNNQKNIENNGGYSAEDVIWHIHSNKLMVKILELWTNRIVPIIDIGCGHNWYVNTLNKLGYAASGWDLIRFPGVNVWDITKPMDFINTDKPLNVISLEVGEHIPAEYSDAYLDNVTRFGGEIIMSWAVIGQAGIGHINCLPNEVVIEKMLARNYVLDIEKTAALRESVQRCHCSWFRNTLMYFSPCE